MIHSVFNDKLSILETNFINYISEQDIIDYLLAFKNTPNYPRVVRTLVDTRNASFSFSYKSIKAFNKAKTESLVHYTIVASAVIINNPAKAAISTLYGLIANNKQYKYKVFSTKKAAISWLLGLNLN